MNEVGIDLSLGKPKYLSEELASGADMLVTMGCGDACPFVPGLEIRDWALTDPKGLPLERVRQIRNEIRQRMTALVREQNWE